MNNTPPALSRFTGVTSPAIIMSAVAWCWPGMLLAADGVQPRSHLQPVSEIVRAPTSGEGLGIVLRRASPVLRRQLALKRGAGLVVEDVAEGSRAAQAGFVQHDVLVRLDDQLLLLPEQFDALLESAEADDRLECVVLRGGREVTVPLAERQVVTAAATTPIRRPLRPTASTLALVQSVSEPEEPAGGRLRRLSDETLLRQDPDYQIRLSRGEETRLLVSDATGRVVFDGPIDAAADRARVPNAVRPRVVEMERYLERTDSPAAIAGGSRPVAEIGGLGIRPVELR